MRHESGLIRRLRGSGMGILGTLALASCVFGMWIASDATAGAYRQPEKEEEAKVEAKDEAKPEKLTLDRIFPKKSFFGPSARSTSFSYDGRFAAFLYRSNLERRHGTDLYIHDTKTGQTRRITSVGRLSEFQADTRKVRDDREKKAKQAGITLRSLAREQYEKMGWTDGLIVGKWAGTTEQGSTPLAGEVALTLTETGASKHGGTLRVGLSMLELSSVEIDEAAGTGKAKIDETALKAKGEVEFKLEGGTLKVDVKMTEPEQTLALSLARDASEPDVKSGDEKDKPKEPIGVIDSIGERLTLGDIVLADDADINEDKDDKPVKDPAPRYDGVSSIEWSTKANEMLVQTGGDIYRLTIDLDKWDAPMERPKREAAETKSEGATDAAKPENADPNADESESGEEADNAGEDGVDGGETEDEKVEDTDDAAAAGKDADESKSADERAAKKKAKQPELKPVAPYRGDLVRLTRTRERESDVQYLPDGSGYTYLRGGALLRVSFGDHQIIQLDPELKDGERMVGYRISPDMKRLVFLASRSVSNGDGASQVTIINYRDRFARAQEVRRHMPDNPLPESYSSVYLYDLKGHGTEEGMLERVFTRRVSGPRDIMHVPEWSPDSSRIAFAAFDQQQGHMKILEAGFKTEEKKKEDAKKAKEKTDKPAADEKTEEVKKDDDKQEEEKQDEEKDVEVKKEDQGEKKVEGEKVEGEKKGGEGEADKEGDKASAEAEELAFKIENARVVYQFLHAGGPNTPGMVRPMYLPDGKRMVFITELSGYRQLHLLDPRYEQLTQVTSGQFELYPFHHTRDYKALYATSTEGDPNQEHVYRIDLETLAMTRLTQAPGVYSSVAVREDGSLLLALQTDFGSPTELYAIKPAGAETVATKLTDSQPEEAHKLTRAAPEYFTYENRHGQVIHGHMFKPADWTPEDKRPLLIYVYGGPLGERKMATRGSFAAPSYFFARYMAENHGWVTATIDPRGASGYGAVFEKANFEQVGKPQTEDLVDGARWFVKHHGVDEKKMAMHGWSFGGFQTQMVMYTEPDVFAVGIAGAGPTEWHNYNSWYSTGTIGANNPGKTDLEKYSLLPLAKNLKGKLLLVHGVEDSNVLYQDTVRVYRELLKADKEVNVELFIDPTGGHGLEGDVKTIGRYRKYEDFLIRNLGKGMAASKPDPAPAADPVAESKPEGSGS